MTTFHAFAKPSIAMKIRLNAWSRGRVKGDLTDVSGERRFAATRVTWLLLALCCWSGARAAETPATPEKSALERFLERDYLLGDWGGLRSKLSTNGVDFEFVWFGSLPANVGGGMKQGS